jgi:hypothetical protein
MSFRVSIKFRGLNQLARTFATAGSRLPTLLKTHTIIAGRKLDHAVKENILRQNFPPLNAKYKKWKIRMGLDPRIMLRTHRMWRAIQFKYGEPSFEYGGIVGINPTAMYPRYMSGIVGIKGENGKRVRGKGKRFKSGSPRSIATVVDMHERGVARGARPIFKPIAKQQEMVVVYEYNKAILKAFGQDMNFSQLLAHIKKNW